MKKYLEKSLFFLLIFVCFNLDVQALREAVVDRYTYTLQKEAKDIITLGRYGLDYNGVNATVYEFFDDNHLYNIVYTIKDDATKMGWITLNSDLKSIKTEKTIDAKLNVFGNAIYKDGYLYVVYGKRYNKETLNERSNPNIITLEVVKYDSDGRIVADLPLAGKETSRMTKTNQSDTAIEYGTATPFDSGNCDIAINSSGVMRVLFNKEMYSGHTMSYNLFIDTKDLTYLNRPSTMDSKNRYYNYIGVTSTGFWISHSFEERVIATSDGDFLSVDQGDAHSRSMELIKGYVNTNGVENLSKYQVFHFRESKNYNNTFASTGNLIELDDGYLLVATSEKTLSLNYSPHYTLNESRNIFIQKYTKDLRGKNTQSIQLFNTELRQSEVARDSSEGIENKFLSSKQVTDYGVKWITDYKNDYNISEVRAVKINDNRVMILWAENEIAVSGKGYTPTGKTKYYYMIIDHNGHVVVEKTIFNRSTLSNLIDYVYKDGYLYFSESDGNGHITLNKVNVNETAELATLSTTTPEVIEVISEEDNTYQIHVTSNKKQGITWVSRDPSVATVDNTGKVTILKNGSVNIEATLDEYDITKSFRFDVCFRIQDIRLAYDISTFNLGSSRYITFNYFPENAGNKKLHWEVEDDSILELSNSESTGGMNLVRPKKIGETNIIVTTVDGSNIRKVIPVKVQTVYTSLQRNDSYYKTMNIGDTVTLDFIATPSDASETIFYITSDSNVATVDENGVVKAVGLGKATIRVNTAITPGLTYEITVNKDLKDVTLKQDTIYLVKGSNEKIEYVTVPIDTDTISKVIYQSFNTTIVDVDANGNLLAKGNGSTTVRVYFYNQANRIFKTLDADVTVGDYLKGDMNRNGHIDLTDILLLIKLYFNKIDSTNYYELVGDMNNNQTIDLTDILLLIKNYFNKE